MNLDGIKIEEVGIYGRFSNEELQRSSISDQIRECRRVCEENGWCVNEDFVKSDDGLSGATLASRTALVTLLDDIEKSAGRITGLIIFNTSRLGRSIADVMHIYRLLKFFGVFIYFVSNKLDSRDPNFYQALVQHAQGDEQFLVNLSAAVKLGQRNCVLEGMIHGGRYFGYKSVAIPDPTRRGTVSRPPILGVKLAFEPAEMASVRRVWDLALDGLSYLAIARKCEEESLPRWSPDQPWEPGFIGDILHNQLYRGRFIWGRTMRVKDPRTGKIINKVLPEKDWVIGEVPLLAIVTEEEWNRVHALIAGHKSFGKSQLGGMGRAKGTEPLL